jgi:segregation and condensation protein B
MDQAGLTGIIEAILFIKGEPVAVNDLVSGLGSTRPAVESALATLQDGCAASTRGLRINRHGETVQLTTRPELAPYVEMVLQPPTRQALTHTVLETLSIIAFRQPVTKPEVEAIRGVKCDYSVQFLLTRGLIAEAGRREALGRPIEYITTDEFLRHFGIESINDLPAAPLIVESEHD